LAEIDLLIAKGCVDIVPANAAPAGANTRLLPIRVGTLSRDPVMVIHAIGLVERTDPAVAVRLRGRRPIQTAHLGVSSQCPRRLPHRRITDGHETPAAGRFLSEG
jgi:hypothetical protein